jgi:hypothetical protein
MMLQQTVTIPADRRLYLDWTLPRDTPTGEADVKLIITLKRVPRSAGVSSEGVPQSATPKPFPPKPKDAPLRCNSWQDRRRPGEDPFARLDAHGPFGGPSVDEFLAERHAENEREEAKMAALFGRKYEMPT